MMKCKVRLFKVIAHEGIFKVDCNSIFIFTLFVCIYSSILGKVNSTLILSIIRYYSFSRNLNSSILKLIKLYSFLLARILIYNQNNYYTDRLLLFYWIWILKIASCSFG